MNRLILIINILTLLINIITLINMIRLNKRLNNLNKHYYNLAIKDRLGRYKSIYSIFGKEEFKDEAGNNKKEEDSR